MAAADGGVGIRPLRDGDGAPVLALARTLRRWFSPHDLREMEDVVRDHPSGWIAEAGGAMIGFLLDAPAPDPGVREIAWMAVAAEWQDRGIGSRLLERLCEALAVEGVRAVEVATVAESSGYAPYVATRAFYHRRGFVDVRVDPDRYWPGGDRLVLRRALPAAPAHE